MHPITSDVACQISFANPFSEFDFSFKNGQKAYDLILYIFNGL